ncbi:hypothetical protein FKM82_019008 [Ascaphus truei]
MNVYSEYPKILVGYSNHRTIKSGLPKGTWPSQSIFYFGHAVTKLMPLPPPSQASEHVTLYNSVAAKRDIVSCSSEECCWLRITVQ